MEQTVYYISCLSSENHWCKPGDEVDAMRQAKSNQGYLQWICDQNGWPAKVEIAPLTELECRRKTHGDTHVIYTLDNTIL